MSHDEVRDWIPEPHIDPLARYACSDIDAFALVGAFRFGGNRAAAKALGDIIERRAWKGGMPPAVMFAEMLDADERARLRGKIRDAVAQ